MPTYQTIHTTYGLQRMAQAEATGTPIKLTAMAVGDGNGIPVFPAEDQGHLVREMYRAAPNRVYQDPDTPAKFTAELVIPASVGGFVLREVGIFDDAGGLYAVANLPETYKPTDNEGAFSDTAVRLTFLVANTDLVLLQVDPNVAVATQAWITQNITIGKLLPGGLTGQIATKRTNADGDIVWSSPADINVVVDIVEEEQLLANGQTQVDLAVTNTTGLAVYINGDRLPRDASAGGWQADPAIPTRLQLGQAYAAGAQLIAVQNEPASHAEAALQQSQNLADLTDASTARANLGVYSRDESDRLAPVSEVAYFARGTAPAGWLKANGAGISRTAYAALFAAIGTTFGAGDGFNTFNLPDLRGEFLRGLDDGRGVDAGRAIGSSQVSQNLAHSHGGSTDVGGSHSHGYVDGRPVNPSGPNGLAAGSNWPGVWEEVDQRTTGTAGSHSHGITTSISGGTEARPRNVALLACIKF